MNKKNLPIYIVPSSFNLEKLIKLKQGISKGNIIRPQDKQYYTICLKYQLGCYQSEEENIYEEAEAEEEKQQHQEQTTGSNVVETEYAELNVITCYSEDPNNAKFPQQINYKDEKDDSPKFAKKSS